MPPRPGDGEKKRRRPWPVVPCFNYVAFGIDQIIQPELQVLAVEPVNRLESRFDMILAFEVVILFARLDGGPLRRRLVRCAHHSQNRRIRRMFHPRPCPGAMKIPCARRAWQADFQQARGRPQSAAIV